MHGMREFTRVLRLLAPRTWVRLAAFTLLTWALLWFGAFDGNDAAALEQAGGWVQFATAMVLLLGLGSVGLVWAAVAMWRTVPSMETALKEAEGKLIEAPTQSLVEQFQLLQEKTNQQLESALDSNVTLRIQAERANYRLKNLVLSAEERVIAIDQDGRIIAISGLAATFLAVRSADATGKRWNEVLFLFNAKKDNPREYPLTTYVDDVIARSSAVPSIHEVVVRDRRDNYQRAMLYSEAVLDAAGAVVGAILRFTAHDASGERNGVTGTLVDPTTKLPTYADFDERLSELISISQKQHVTHQLLMFTVDELQKIYDQQGFWAGEELLWQVAQLVSEIIHDSVELFRVTAIHFAMLLPFENSNKAELLAEKLRVAISEGKLSWRDRPYQVTASFSLSGIDETAAGTAAVLSHADEGIRAARLAGGNRVHRHELDELLVETREIERELISWLSDEDSNQLQLQSRALHSQGNSQRPLVEAILRIAMEDGFWADPAAFVSSAQNFGLSHQIDNWLLRHTLGALLEHPEILDQHQLAIVPVAGESLLSARFAADVAQAFHQLKVDPGRVVLLVDELTARNRQSKVTSFREAMKDIGVAFGLRNCRVGAVEDLVPQLYPQVVGLHPALWKVAGLPRGAHQIECIQAEAREVGFLTYASGIKDPKLREELFRLGVNFVGDEGVPLGPLSGFGGQGT